MDQQRLIERSRQKASPFVIWDVGLGAAANALAVVEGLHLQSVDIELHSFDCTTDPLEFALNEARSLHYLLEHEFAVAELIVRGVTWPAPRIRWHLHRGDFCELVADLSLPAPDAVLYDPYSPTTNIEMWTLDHFCRLRTRLDEATPCLLTNYTCSTAVRTTLLLAGFYVGVGWGVGEKVETTIASNRKELLEKPLDREWLKRVRASHSAAPLRAAPRTVAAISDEDFVALKNLPQFVEL
ncbi:MAG: hypothetical protein JST16_07985 [Bdellovibrionales bacterium]|nr:hypothetical protein [Bdellovibrionales bacterium]